MGARMIFMSLVIMIISMGFLISQGGAARVYKIGESGGGWKVYKDREYYYQRWTEDKQFFVGDSLVFEYDNSKGTFFSFDLDDVTEVTGHLEFKFCDPTSAKAVHKTGHDVVTFKEPGIHYFINSAQGKCYAGQKLRVLVLPDPDPSHPPSIPMPSFVPSSGKVFKVGDSNEWTTKADPMWYEDKNFQVGDSLLFQYDKDLDNVVQVSGALEMEFCDPSSPLAVYETGHDVVKLDSPGSYYFISSKPGRCAAGLRLDVLVTTRDSPIQAPSPLQ